MNLPECLKIEEIILWILPFMNVTDFNVLPNFKHNDLSLVLKMIKMANMAIILFMKKVPRIQD